MDFPTTLASLAATGPGQWCAEVDDSWLQGRGLFGGIQTALAVRALRRHLPEAPALRTLQTTFVGPAAAGPLRIETRLLRAGRSAVQAEARLYTGDDLATLYVAVFGEARPSALNLALSPVVAAREPEASIELPCIPGLTPTFIQHLRLRWADGGFPFSGAGQARTQVWVELREHPVIDESAVLVLADAIPSPLLSLLRRPAPASSLTWTLELLVPPTGQTAEPWLMAAQVDAAADGYGAQTALLCDRSGRPQALSRQSIVVFA